MILDSRSLGFLSQVHEDLAKVIAESAVSWNEPWIWKITEGKRTKERQAALVKLKLSQTMQSRHITGHAVDFAVFIDGLLTWDFKWYKKVAEHILATGKKLKIDVEWGGNWKTFKDGPHIQLSKGKYP